MAFGNSKYIDALKDFMEPMKVDPEVPSEFELSETQEKFLDKIKKKHPYLISPKESVMIESILASGYYTKEDKKTLMEIRRRYKKERE